MERKNLIGYPIVIILTVVLTLLFSRCDRGVTAAPPVKPKEIISFDDALQLYESYTTNRSCVIEAFESKRDSVLNSLCPSDREPKPGFVPTRSFRLSAEFLDQYMDYIKKITPDSIKITGYRLYLANYPDSTNFGDGRPIKDPRRNTLFVAPTTNTGSPDFHRGYTFVDKNNDGKPELLFLEDELGERTQNPKGPMRQQKQPQMNAASFFSFYMTNFEELSTIANELGSHP